ncbi:MAG: hypothetical protein FD159_2542 [Syntrophaceae bacterium]|nr:MAG: hypothetical protein FD159_2542 [Syntrophaceae bacterium]
MICMIALIAVLIPCAAGAQGDAQTSSQQTFSNEELAQMLAPIALYPDALLSQILMAATYPFEVVEAERWLTKNPYVKGDALDEALQAKDWDVSVLALCHYPKVLTMMSENLNWTARLGDAFTNQEEDVMDTIQELRARARAAGNLATTPEQKVIIEERYIRIEPIGLDYIYLPAYDPYVVYGHWWLPLFPPFPIILPGLVVAGPGIIFSPRFYVGFGVFGWSSFNWRERSVVIVNIDRTRRFNRRYYDYRGPDHRWRPDRDRRYVRERRGGEIPRFHPPGKPVPPGQPWDRRLGGDGPDPGRRRMPPDRPRVPSVTDREKRPIPRLDENDRRPDGRVPSVTDMEKRPIPRLDDRERRPDGGTPVIINREKQPRLGQPETDPGKHPGSGVPRITDSDRVKQPDRRLIEQDKPVQVRERDMKSDQRFTPRAERQDVPQRSIDRGDRPQRDGMNREGRK